MNITHVCKVWYPRTTGVTVHVDCLARWMKAEGHGITVVTYDLAGDLPSAHGWAEEERNGYRVIRVRPGDSGRFQNAIEATKPDVVHAHGIWEHVHPAWRAARAINARFALTAHGTWQFLNSTPGMKSLWRRLRYRCYYHTGWRHMVRNADAMIALNAVEEEAHRSLSAKNVFRIPNGVDCREFRPGGHPPLPLEMDFPKPYFLYAGAVQTQKGVFTLLESLCRLKEKKIFPKLIVAGDGPEFDRAKSVAEDNDLQVRFLGRVDRKHMPRLMADADLFVLPSINEPFATVYLEAMASGTPCVGTDTGGTPEIITDGQTGFLMPVKGVDKLSNIIERILNEPGLVDVMGRSARQIAQSSFDWSKLIPKLLEGYWSMLALTTAVK